MHLYGSSAGYVDKKPGDEIVVLSSFREDRLGHSALPRVNFWASSVNFSPKVTGWDHYARRLDLEMSE